MGRALALVAALALQTVGDAVTVPGTPPPAVATNHGARPPVAEDGGGTSEVARQAGATSAVLGLRVESPRHAFSSDSRRTTVWDWPLFGRPPVARTFDPPEHRWGAGHRGIDLAGVAGEPVRAVDAGVVAFSGTVAGVGVVSVDHASGLRSTYQPVTDGAPAGSRVGRGERLGHLGTGGHCLLADCLHLGARTGRDSYVDPLLLLEPVELSLLPIAGQGGG
ncbi:hypothetical protein GCM10009584_07260 [Ornithinimicrobium humiphilum]